jgi:exonuclease SbcC
MKINNLEITAFGPFKEVQKIDFNALSVDGLFMLEGPTGSGKSSIIDAIVWALYGTTAHQAATDKASSSYSKRIRSDYAEAHEETRVILEFTAGGQQYRIERTAAYEAQKLRGEGTRSIPASARLIFLSKKRESLTKIEEIAREIYDILRMNADQFSQLVILPQGDFASFLHATSDQRQEVLKRIFKTDFYDDISNYFKTRRKEYAELQVTARQEVARHAKNLIDEIGNREVTIPGKDLSDFLSDDNESETKRLSELKKIILQIWPDTTKDNSQVKALESKIKPLRSERDGLEKDASDIAEKAKATKKIESLNQQSEDIDEKVALLKVISKAELLSSKLDVLRDAEEKRDKAFSKLSEELEDETPESVKTQIKKLEDEEKKLIAKLSKFEDIDEDLDRLEEDYIDAKENEDLKKSIPGLKAKVVTAEKKVAVQKAKIAVYKTKRKDGYAHLIKLVKGKPCPVCGSSSHPKPVKGKGVFDEIALQAMEQDLEYFKEDLGGLQSDLKLAAAATKKKFEPSLKIKERERLLKAEKGKIEKLQYRLYEIEDSLKLFKNNLQFLIDYFAYAKVAEEAEMRLDKALNSAGIEDLDELEELLNQNPKDLAKQIDVFNKELSATKALLAQKRWAALPKPEALKSKLEKISTTLASLELNLAEVQARLAQSAGTIERLDRISNGISRALSDLKKIAKDGAPYLSLDRWVDGKNIHDLKLTNYVLQERLELILQRASVILRKISHGKYEFRLNDERVGRQRTAGLGITVLDCHTGYERPAETLSGGETFYASLSLALGLAEVIKADQGGIELGTLFIDEGFGSLSDDTLEEVRIVLEDLRSADRIIGIVSHVEGMKTQIPLRLEVRRPTLTGPSKVRIAVLGQA